jgi:nitrogen regulatory protein PII
MKLITAIIRPDKLDELIPALIGNGVHGGLCKTPVIASGRNAVRNCA